MSYEPADIPVFILCGGLGTRLREQTEFRPKPMVQVGNHPILWHINAHVQRAWIPPICSLHGLSKRCCEVLLPQLFINELGLHSRP